MLVGRNAFYEQSDLPKARTRPRIKMWCGAGFVGCVAVSMPYDAWHNAVVYVCGLHIVLMVPNLDYANLFGLRF